MGAFIGAGLATFGMGGAAIGIGLLVGQFMKASMAHGGSKAQMATLFIGIAFVEALGIFSFLVALLLMFAV